METPASLLERLRLPAQEQAWVRFVELYTPLLFHWASRWEPRPQDAADLVQEVLLHLYQKLPEFTYDAQRSFRAWLHTLMHNRWRNLHRRFVVPPVGGDPAALSRLPAPDDDSLTEDDYRRHLTRRALELMQKDFQPATWRAFWACTVDGRPTAEVAAQLGMTLGAVRAAKCRVLCRLRQELKGLLS
ncbi:MAG TPA: sigma-70 family RNA polymerase sigma factor [Gemmataceae bacterium]|jgi:RNA polymerase sigma-70 factor (ECF subfamily)